MAKGPAVQKVNEADLEEARSALVEGQKELVRLREAFLNDAGVEWSAVKSQEAVVEYAEAQIERLARARARYQADVRLSAAIALHDEINAHAMGIGPKLADMARTYYETRLGFLAAADGHNKVVAEFLARAVELEVPESDGRPVGFAKDGKLQRPRNREAVQAGRRELHRIDGPQYISRLDEYGDIDAVAAALASIDAELPEPDGNVVHFRGSGGGVFTFDPEHVPSSEERKRNGLTEISQAEAWGEDDA